MSLSQFKVLIFDVYGTLVVRFIQTLLHNKCQIFKETSLRNIGLGNRHLQLARAPRCGCGPSMVQIGRPPRLLVRRVGPASEEPDRALYRHPSGGLRRAVPAHARSTEHARNQRKHRSASRSIKRSSRWSSHARDFLRGHLIVGIGIIITTRRRRRGHRSGGGSLRNFPRRLAPHPRHDIRARKALLHARPQARRPLER